MPGSLSTFKPWLAFFVMVLGMYPQLVIGQHTFNELGREARAAVGSGPFPFLPPPGPYLDVFYWEAQKYYGLGYNMRTLDPHELRQTLHLFTAPPPLGFGGDVTQALQPNNTLSYLRPFETMIASATSIPLPYPYPGPRLQSPRDRANALRAARYFHPSWSPEQWEEWASLLLETKAPYFDPDPGTAPMDFPIQTTADGLISLPAVPQLTIRFGLPGHPIVLTLPFFPASPTACLWTGKNSGIGRGSTPPLSLPPSVPAWPSRPDFLGSRLDGLGRGTPLPLPESLRHTADGFQ